MIVSYPFRGILRIFILFSSWVLHKNKHNSYTSRVLYIHFTGGRDLIVDGFRFTTCINSLHLLKILYFEDLARYLVNKSRTLIWKLGGWIPGHLGAEHPQAGNRVQTIWKTIYINKPRKFVCTLLKVKPSVTLHFIQKEATEPLHNDFLCWIRQKKNFSIFPDL